MKNVVKWLIALCGAAPPVKDLEKGVGKVSVKRPHFEKAFTLKTGRVIDSDQKRKKVTAGPALASIPKGHFTKKVSFGLGGPA